MDINKKYKSMILFILIFLFMICLNNKVYSASYDFKGSNVYSNMPQAILNTVREIEYFKNNNYACFGFYNSHYPYRFIFIENTSLTVSIKSKGKYGAIYPPSERPIHIYTINSEGVITDIGLNYNDSYGYDDLDSHTFLFKNIKVDSFIDLKDNEYISFENPYIANTPEDFATGNFDYVLVLPGSLTSNDNIGLKLNKVNTIKFDLDGDGTEEEHETFDLIYKTQLDNYMKDEGASGDLFWYEFPQSSFGVNFKEGDRFCLQLVNDINKIYLEEDYKLYQEIYFTIGGLSEDDKANNRVNSIIESNKKTEEAIKNQTEAIKEQTETNKGMWESIKTILNLLNPFSKDFFAYKLVELFLNMLKSLFIPSDDFFSNYIDELNQQFSDTFGILYYPIDLLIDFLNRVGSINESSAIISVPQFDISFMGYQATVIPEYSFDFNSILTNDTLKRLHDMYLVFVDILLWLGVVYLASNCIREIVGGMSGQVVDANVSDEKSYQRYEQYQSNRKRYKKEHK